MLKKLLFHKLLILIICVSSKSFANDTNEDSICDANGATFIFDCEKTGCVKPKIRQFEWDDGKRLQRQSSFKFKNQKIYITLRPAGFKTIKLILGKYKTPGYWRWLNEEGSDWYAFCKPGKYIKKAENL